MRYTVEIDMSTPAFTDPFGHSGVELGRILKNLAEFLQSDEEHARQEIPLLDINTQVVGKAGPERNGRKEQT